MTIIEAINRADASRPNGIEQSEKIRWLSRLDGIIKLEIIDTHEGGEGIVYTGYSEGTPLDTVLIVPEPWCDLYIHYLESRIDYAYSDFDKYNNANMQFSEGYDAFAAWYHRTHSSKASRFKYL